MFLYFCLTTFLYSIQICSVSMNFKLSVNSVGADNYPGLIRSDSDRIQDFFFNLFSCISYFVYEFVVNFGKSSMKYREEGNSFLLLFGWSVLKVSVNSIWFILSVITSISLFSVYLDDLSTGESCVVKSFITILCRSICDFRCSNVSFTNFSDI